jgi:hypothetical protein
MPGLLLLNVSPAVWLTVGIAVLGIVLLIISAKWSSGKVGDVLRDIGIAFLVAAVVSSVYELHTRSILDLAKIEGVLKTVLASNIPEDAWEHVNSEILQRNVIRKNFVIRLRLRQDPDLPGTQLVLWMENDYDLHGLKSEPSRFQLQAAVDKEMWNESKNLPRFESVSVGTTTLQGDELFKHVDSEGVFTLSDVGLDPKGGQPVHVVIKRSEITNRPGTYHLIFPELTQGISVHIDDLPPDVEADLKIWSNKGYSALQPAGDGIWYFNSVMLPGQSLAFRFKNKH